MDCLESHLQLHSPISSYLDDVETDANITKRFTLGAFQLKMARKLVEVLEVCPEKTVKTESLIR